MLLIIANMDPEPRYFYLGRRSTRLGLPYATCMIPNRDQVTYDQGILVPVIHTMWWAGLTPLS